MGYTGRVIGVVVMLSGIIIMRIYAYMYLNYPFTAFPFIGLIFIGIAFAAGKQYDKVKSFSEKDGLTNCYNRRFIGKAFPSLLAQVDKKNGKLSLAVLDCDNFKSINDAYGHKKGDLVLQEISALILTSIRKKDLAARWGGDEFIIIAPHADQAEIQKIIDRLEHALQGLSEKLQIDVRISSGIATYPRDASQIEDLIQIADREMYAFKNARTKRGSCVRYH